MGQSEALKSETMKLVGEEDTAMMEERGQHSSHRWVLMADRVFLSTVLVLGASSIILGFIAEVYNFQDSHAVIINCECIFSGDLHINVGVAAAVTLFFAVVLVTVMSCAQRFPPRSLASMREGSSLKYLMGSWITFAFAAYFFLAGVMAREQNHPSDFLHGGVASGENSAYQHERGVCVIVKPTAYIKGSILAFVTILECLIYYVAVLDARRINAAYTPIRSNVIDVRSETFQSQV